MTRPATKAELTRARILDVALDLLRRRGLEATTMRDVVAGAGLSLGSVYYHFRSKETIMLAYFERSQAEHAARAIPLLAEAPDLRARLGVVLHTKLDAVRRDRKLLGALVRRSADPGDPISAFANETATIREQAIALFDRALDGAGLPADTRPLAARALWLLHLGLLLYFVRDRSRGQARTRRLVDDLLDIATPLVGLAASPAAAPLVTRLSGALARAGLGEVSP